MKKNNKGFVSIVLLLAVALVFAGGVYFVVFSGEDEDGNAVEETTSATQDQVDEAAADSAELLNEGDYPALYTQYGLPEYPGATLTYDGRTADNLSDGISLILTTQDDPTTVGAYFATAFAALTDWDYTPPNVVIETLYGATATHAGEGLRYTLTVTQLPDYTQISISFLEA